MKNPGSASYDAILESVALNPPSITTTNVLSSQPNPPAHHAQGNQSAGNHSQALNPPSITTTNVLSSQPNPPARHAQGNQSAGNHSQVGKEESRPSNTENPINEQRAVFIDTETTERTTAASQQEAGPRQHDFDWYDIFIGGLYLVGCCFALCSITGSIQFFVVPFKIMRGSMNETDCVVSGKLIADGIKAVSVFGANIILTKTVQFIYGLFQVKASCVVFQIVLKVTTIAMFESRAFLEGHVEEIIAVSCRATGLLLLFTSEFVIKHVVETLSMPAFATSEWMLIMIAFNLLLIFPTANIGSVADFLWGLSLFGDILILIALFTSAKSFAGQKFVRRMELRQEFLENGNSEKYKRLEREFIIFIQQQHRHETLNV